MDEQALNALVALAGDGAFAVRDGRIQVCGPGAAALGFAAGAAPEDLVPGLVLPGPEEGLLRRRITLGGRPLELRATRQGDAVLCVVQSYADPGTAPNLNTLIHISGSARMALQDIVTALDALADHPAMEDEDFSRNAALSMRGVLRMIRATGALDLFSALQRGQYVLRPSLLPLGEMTGRLTQEAKDLLRPLGINLDWTPPVRQISGCVDWDLLSVLLWELIANAAADTADKRLGLSLARLDRGRVVFTVTNRPSNPLPGELFQRHAADWDGRPGGLGLGLSLVRAGAACHGGSLLLSPGEGGTVRAALSCALLETKQHGLRAPEAGFHMGYHPGLVALSGLLPPESFRLEDVLF